METPSPAIAYAGTLVDAQRAWSALKGHGIEAVLLNQHVQGWYGVGVGAVEVAVPAAELEDARGLLEELGLVTPAPEG